MTSAFHHRKNLRVYSHVPTKRPRTAQPLPNPEEKIRALSVLLDRIIGRNKELMQEVTALKRSIAVLKRQRRGE